MRAGSKRGVSIVVAGLLLVGPALAATDGPWVSRPGKALDLAKESGQPILADLWAIWCKPCKAMDEKTYTDPRVREALDEFVALRVDVDAETIFTRRYAVEAYPTTLFLDAEGREVARYEGFLAVEEMLQLLDRVRAGYRDYVEDRARTADPWALARAAEYLTSLDNPDEAVRLLRKALKTRRKSGDGPAERLELALARAQLRAGRTGSATRELERLAAEAAERRVRGLALVELVRADAEDGESERAERRRARLAQDFPDLAAELD